MHNGTAKMKHPKRGGWKGAKNSAGKNRAGNEMWKQRKRDRNAGVVAAESVK